MLNTPLYVQAPRRRSGPSYQAPPGMVRTLFLLIFAPFCFSVLTFCLKDLPKTTHKKQTRFKTKRAFWSSQGPSGRRAVARGCEHPGGDEARASRPYYLSLSLSFSFLSPLTLNSPNMQRWRQACKKKKRPPAELK